MFNLQLNSVIVRYIFQIEGSSLLMEKSDNEEGQYTKSVIYPFLLNILTI